MNPTHRFFEHFYLREGVLPSINHEGGVNPTHRPIFLPHGVNNGGGVHPTCHPFFLHLITCIWGLPFLRGLTTLQGRDSHTACPFSVCLSPNGGVMTSTQWGGVCRGSANPTCCPLSTLLQCWQGSVNATCCPFLFVHNTVVCIVSFCPHFPSFPPGINEDNRAA